MLVVTKKTVKILTIGLFLSFYINNAIADEVNYAYNIPKAKHNIVKQPDTVKSYYVPPLKKSVWAGPYLGIIFGSSNNKAELIKAHKIQALKNSKLDLGLMAGMNFEQNNFVYGIEASAIFPINKNQKHLVNIKDRFNAKLRARLGLDFGKYLPYAFVGLATNYSMVKDNSDNASKFNNFHFDYNYGAGLDYNIRGELFVRLEGEINKTSKQTINLNDYKLNLKDHSYNFHIGLAKLF